MLNFCPASKEAGFFHWFIRQANIVQGGKGRGGMRQEFAKIIRMILVSRRDLRGLRNLGGLLRTSVDSRLKGRSDELPRNGA